MEETDKENLKIVVVEDSNLARKSIIETLENEGFDVVGEAPNAEQAMVLIQCFLKVLKLSSMNFLQNF